MIEFPISSFIKRLQILLFFFLVSNHLHSQPKCFRFDEKLQLAFNLNDSNLYTGNCRDYYPSGNLQSSCVFDSGKIKLCTFWGRRGNLIDSLVYIISYKKFKEYHFSGNRRLESICVYYLKKNSKDSSDFYDYEDAEYFYLNGNIKRKLKYYLDKKNRYLETKYYKNGNIKSTVVCYDIVTQITTNFGMNKILYDSTYTEYSKDGRKIKEIIYKDGEQISETKF